MPLIYITGAAGSGKSAIQNALTDSGHAAYDTDDPAIGAPYDNQTDKVVAMPPATARTPEWFATHSWRISEQSLQNLKSHAEDNTIFVCGSASNELDILGYFDTVIGLDIDEQTIRQRIATRKDNDFGKNDYELAMILERARAIKYRYHATPVQWLNANRPLSEIIQDILEIVSD
jgi:dephospho-CoA kinase